MEIIDDYCDGKETEKVRMMWNIDSLECCVCEGIFSTGEKVIKEDDKLYCEACYEELENK